MTKKEEKKIIGVDYGKKPGVDVSMKSLPDTKGIKIEADQITVNGKVLTAGTPATFRSSKVEKFVAKKVLFMEAQEKVIQNCKAQGLTSAAIAPIEYNQVATYNLIFELCQEFGITMPHVAGVTPGN